MLRTADKHCCMIVGSCSSTVMSSSSSNKLVSTDSGSAETQRLLQSHSHRRDEQHIQISCNQCLLKLKSLCMFSKPVYLILMWTLIVGAIYAGMLYLAAGFISSSAILSSSIFNNTNPFISPLCITQAVLALTAMLYPLSGFLADVWCGRFKAVMIGLSCLLFSTVISVVILVWFNKGYNNHVIFAFNDSNLARICIISMCVCPFMLVGLAAYYANIIQLGLDQLMEESSMHLSLFTHWAIWMKVLGTAIVGVPFGFVFCNLSVHTKIAIVSAPFLILFGFPFVLVCSCWKRRWFIVHPAQHNPYKAVFKVLNFTRSHKWPLRCSAFTYCDDEMPSRIDFAKERYGGPFTTEQVEDVKAFLGILGLLLILGPLFIVDIPSSFMDFPTFGAHTGFFEDFRHRCNRWAILDTGSFKYISGSIFIPFYIVFHFLLLKQRIKIFTRLCIGLVLYFLWLLSMLIIDLAGHLHSVNDQGVGSHCMFTYATINGTLLFPVLELHWSVLLPPNILLGIGSPVVMITILEFISAQSPQSMKGLLIGAFFAIKGIFQLISTVVLFLFSTNTIWVSRHVTAVTNCGFGYLLFTCAAALVSLILFSVVARRYKYRERDDRPYDQSQIEEIFYRRTLMRSPSPSD